MAKKEKPGTALVNWDAEFASLAKESTKGIKESTNGKFLSFKSGNMTFNGDDIPDNKLECVIIGVTHHNTYYDPDARYDPKNPQSPICYSFGADEEEMEPHDDSPEKQHSDCASCPFNQFESAKTGRGKACKNTYRIALIASSDLDNISEAEIVYASIPPKSLKNLSNYLKKDLNIKLNRPYWSVVTELSCTPDAESQFKINFKLVEIIKDQKLFQPLKDLWFNTIEDIVFPYQVREAVEEKPAKKAAKPSKFARK